jgi:hypothetical protein
MAILVMCNFRVTNILFYLQFIFFLLGLDLDSAVQTAKLTIGATYSLMTKSVRRDLLKIANFYFFFFVKKTGKNKGLCYNSPVTLNLQGRAARR